MNLKSITKSAAKLAVGAALTTGFAASVRANDLPEDYTELEYVETSGRQYLNTGYLPTTNMIVDAKVEMHGGLLGSSCGNVFAAFEGEWACGLNYGGGGNTSTLYCWFFRTYERGWYNVEALDVGDNNGNVVTLGFDATTGVFVYGTATRTCTRPTHEFTRCPLYISAYVDPDDGTKVTPFDYFRMRIYSWKISDGDVPRRHYVPCQDDQGVAGLYDLVNGTFKASDSGTAFVSGPVMKNSVRVVALAENVSGGSVSVMQDGKDVNDQPVARFSTVTLKATPAAGYVFKRWLGVDMGDPHAAEAEIVVADTFAVRAIFCRQDWKSAVPAGYERLEYVKTTRTQYLDTGFYPCPKTQIDASIQTEGDFGGSCGTIYGAAEGNYSFSANFGGGGSDSVYAWMGKSYDAGAWARYADGANAVNGTRVALCADSRIGVFAYGCADVDEVDTTPHDYREATLAFPGCNDGGTFFAFNAFDLRIYSFRILVDDLLVRDYLPCRRTSDGAVGFYETVAERFVVSSASDGFVAGDKWSGREWAPRTVVHIPGKEGLCGTGFAPSLSSMTASLWVRNAKPGLMQDGSYRYGVLFSQGALSAHDGYCCFVATNTADAASHVELRYQTRNPAHELSIDWNEEANDDKWHLVVATYDRATNAKCLYVDGKLRAEAVANAPDPLSACYYMMGAVINIFGFPLDGDFAEGSLWNRALAKGEVKSLYHGPLTGTESGLLGYWPLTGDRYISPDGVANGSPKHRANVYKAATLVEGHVQWQTGMMLLVQ